MASLSRGQTLNQRFTLLRLLGRGGMGEVWLAEDAELDDRVVVKIVPADASPELVDLLRRECRHARKLVHPNIAPVYDFHRGEDQSFITMALIEGRELGEFRGQSPETIARLLAPVAGALDYAHRRGIVHRDIKPSNIVVDETGAPHLLDFGIAGALSEASSPRGGGTDARTSPEQQAGARPTPRDDIYAFGVLLFELLVGAPPVEEGEPIRSPHPIPESLGKLVSRMLDRDPDRRPESMGVVKDVLDEVQSKTAARAKVTLRPPPKPRRITPVPPPKLAGSAPPVRPLADDAHRGGIGWKTTVGFLVLALLTVGVFVVLPRIAENNRTPARPEAVSEPEAVPPAEASTIEPDLEELAIAKTSAEERRDRAVTLRSELEAKQVSRWGGDLYGTAVSSMNEGGAHMDANRYREASDVFERAVGELEAVQARAGDVVRDALGRGRDALAAGRSLEAREAFELALTIRPGDASAQKGLSRASTLDEVFALIASGEERERRGDLKGAAERYRKAVALDPLSETAQSALARIDARAAERRFTDAMSRGVALLKERDFRGAREAFERAKAMRPGAKGVADGLRRAEEGIRLEKIATHRENALRFEKTEEWQRAAEAYRAVLDLDETIRFAREGYERSRERAVLDERLVFHLNAPDRLSDPRVLEEASQLLDRAKEVAPPGPKLTGQINALERHVEDFSTPVSVYLISDSKTEVTIYRVGRIGKFDRHALELRPGTYTVVGSREGYRDVREELVVVAGQTPEPLLVRCEEEI